jgi:hypothetical protein
VGRVPDQPNRLVTALSEETLQQKRDLPVPARDYYTHAASLLTQIIGKNDGGATMFLMPRHCAAASPVEAAEHARCGRSGARRLGRGEAR